jgi:hypothetical protein
MSKGSEQPPSAPELEEEHHVGAPAPTNQTSPPYPTLTTSPPTYGSTDQQPDYHQPPPSYNDALSYPQVNHPSQMPKPYTPQTQNPNFGSYPQPNSSVYAGAPLGSGPAAHGQYAPQQPAVVRTVITTTHQPAGNCIWCRQGTVTNETDLCCLICLILLAICTFPFGLVLLCCIPCTVRPRCSQCRRLQD